MITIFEDYKIAMQSDRYADDKHRMVVKEKASNGSLALTYLEIILNVSQRGIASDHITYFTFSPRLHILFFSSIIYTFDLNLSAFSKLRVRFTLFRGIKSGLHCKQFCVDYQNIRNGSVRFNHFDNTIFWESICSCVDFFDGTFIRNASLTFKLQPKTFNTIIFFLNKQNYLY